MLKIVNNLEEASLLCTEIDLSIESRVPNYTLQTATQSLSVPHALLSSKADSSIFALNAENE